MSVRKRKWTTPKGIEREAWVVDYVEGAGVRRLKTFKRKKEADDFEATASVQIREGMHVADSASATVAEAGDLWIASSKAAGLERTTTNEYQRHLTQHIGPFLGSKKLTALTLPGVREFEDRLAAEGRSPVMVKYVVGSLGALLADAQERGLVVRNVVRDMRGRRKRGSERKLERRHKGKLKVGRDIPAPQEIKAIVHAARGRWRPLLLTAIFTGLRASELRGLRWVDVDLARGEVHVRQRADRFNVLGSPKSEAGERTVPLPPIVVTTLREWQAVCPKGPKGLVFPTGAGNIESLGNIVRRGHWPAQMAAGVAVDTGEKDEEGAPVLKARYTGLHSLRHFYA